MDAKVSSDYPRNKDEGFFSSKGTVLFCEIFAAHRLGRRFLFGGKLFVVLDFFLRITDLQLNGLARFLRRAVRVLGCFWWGAPQTIKEDGGGGGEIRGEVQGWGTFKFASCSGVRAGISVTVWCHLAGTRGILAPRGQH